MGPLQWGDVFGHWVPEKDMVLDQALTAILKGAKLIGLDMKKVLGHATVRCMLRRALSSIFRHFYTFGNMVGNVGVCLYGHRFATRSGFFELCSFLHRLICVRVSAVTLP